MARRVTAFVVDRLEQVVPWLVLLLLLTYTFMELVQAPYLGFDFNPSNGAIQEVFSASRSLEPGDILISVDGLPYAERAKSLRRPLVASAQSGDTIVLVIERKGQQENVSWTISEPTWVEFLARLINIWPLGYFFWLAGIVTILSMRPKSGLQRLFAFFFFLTALWIMTGNVSRRYVWDVAVVYRMAVWLCVPVYLHLHWSFPKSLRRLPAFVFPLLYLFGVCAALLQWFELLPKQAYALGFVGALLGSLAFLIIHFVRRPDERQRLAVILYSFAFALVPSAVLGVAAAMNAAPRLGAIVLLILPVLPVGYFYAIYRHRLGGVEMRTNSAITLFLYLILLGTGIVLLSVAVTSLPIIPGRTTAAILTLSLGAVLITLKLYPHFERWIEVHLLGIPYAAESLLESYLLRITTSLTKAELVRILRDEIVPSLLVRQSALLLNRGSRGELLFVHGIPENDVPALYTLTGLLDSHNPLQIRMIRLPRRDDGWVQVCVPLVLDERVLGLWLLGKRDPDDAYTGRVGTIIENIARQTTIALVNTEQAEQLQLLYQADIQRHEEERTRLARTLHDEILNQVAIVYTSLDTFVLSDRLEEGYELLKQQIRRMISDLRPATLRWGLSVALEELVDDLNERGNGNCTLGYEVPPSEARYPILVEEQIFRIVQQACENALRYAQASCIQIGGHLEGEAAELLVEDDGVGFEASESSLASFLEHSHFGLAGMFERAEIIDAQFNIHSTIGRGTTVSVRWAGHAGGERAGSIEQEKINGTH